MGRANRGCHGRARRCLVLPQPKWHWIATDRVAKRKGYGSKERLCACCQLSDLQQRHSSNEVMRSASDDVNGVPQLGRASFSFLALALENYWSAQRMVEELPPTFGFAYRNIDRDRNVPQIPLNRQTSGSQRRRLGMRRKTNSNHDSLNLFVIGSDSCPYVQESNGRRGDFRAQTNVEKHWRHKADRPHVPGEKSIWALVCICSLQYGQVSANMPL
jgi:hypothetical protein